ncbi:MAG: hypothetical protein VXZ39_10470, partial [Planctomycetota bacterium]|nr:hypothetical protein [Planctomycetota bacterium]
MDAPVEVDEPGPDAAGEAAAAQAWRYSRSDRSQRNGPLRRRFRALRRRLVEPLVPALVPPLLRLLSRTWRVSTTDGERRAEVLE